MHYMRRLLAPFRLVFRVASRFHSERLAQTVAALSFATLLGLVPMIALALWLLSHFPFAASMSAALEKFLLANLLPERAGAVIAKYVGRFAHRTDGVPLIGVIGLAATALVQMLTIEHAFNAIWKVRIRRPWLRRLAMHSVALLFGPVAFGGSLVLITYVAGVSFGWLDEPAWTSIVFSRVLPSGFVTVLFSLLYWAAPNRDILPWHAGIGGLIAALGFLVMQRLFELYVANFPVYTAMYGAFAAVPIFLVWLYLSWSIILVGALVVAELPGAGRPAGRY